MSTDWKRRRRKHGAKCVCCGKNHGDGAPWWNKGKSGWSITVGGKSSRLLVKGDGPNDRQAHDKAMAIWKSGDMPAGRSNDPWPTATIPIPVGGGEALTVEQLCDIYLTYLKDNVSPKTYDACKTLYKNLCDHPTHGLGHLTVAQLRHGGVAQIKAWAKAHENWRGSLKTTFARVKA